MDNSQLFDGGNSSDDDISKIEINKEFAHRYEHNKKREDLQKLEELKKKGLLEDSEESSEESAEEDELTNSKKDLEFFDALLKVRNQDSVLKSKEAQLFEAGTESDSEDENEDSVKMLGKLGKKKEKKPMYLKDVVSKHLIEGGPEFEDKEENTGGLKSYTEEQKELRKAFLDAAEEAFDGQGDLLKMKEKEKAGEDEDDEDGGEFGKRLDEYFGKDDKLDKNMMFLKDYFKNRMWMDEGKGEEGLDEEELEFSEDEDEIEKQEDYEREYNFRFEENAGDRVMGHSRFVEGSVRKKTNARKLQRERKEERMAQAEFERKEELKHLKNLKKKEINEKLRKIRETAGIEDGLCPLDKDDLEEEFDPEEYDRKMKEAFDDDYYEAVDVDPDFRSDNDELEKPDFDKENELLGLPKGWADVNESSDGFLAARERILKRKVDNRDDHGQVKEGEKEEETVPEEGKLKKKRKMSSVEKDLRDEWLEEYHKLDYEDTIGDLKTRFKYRDVGSGRYGLNVEEILLMDDKELNQYISLKKLAPYTEKEWKVPRIKIYNQKQRNKSLLQGEISNVPYTGKEMLKSDGPKSTVGVGTKEYDKQEADDTTSDMSNLSRKSRRRHLRAEFKLSRSRLMAYGKVPSKTKNKKKS